MLIPLFVCEIIFENAISPLKFPLDCASFVPRFPKNSIINARLKESRKTGRGIRQNIIFIALSASVSLLIETAKTTVRIKRIIVAKRRRIEYFLVFFFFDSEIRLFGTTALNPENTAKSAVARITANVIKIAFAVRP